MRGCKVVLVCRVYDTFSAKMQVLSVVWQLWRRLCLSPLVRIQIFTGLHVVMSDSSMHGEVEHGNKLDIISKSLIYISCASLSRHETRRFWCSFCVWGKCYVCRIQTGYLTMVWKSVQSYGYWNCSWTWPCTRNDIIPSGKERICISISIVHLFSWEKSPCIYQSALNIASLARYCRSILLF